MKNYPDRSGEKNANWSGGKEVPCAACGKTRWVKPSELESREEIYCSRECAKQSIAGQKNSRWSGGPETRCCKTCDKEFVAKRREINRGGGLFCSRACSAKSIEKEKTAANCLKCGKEFLVSPWQVGKKRYCSRPCQYEAKKRTPEQLARYRVNARISALMYYSLKGKKNGCKWESLTGYTCQELMDRLESLFSPGMSWENMGKWHIDHIRPRSSFSYSTPDDEEFKACWALTNLQPLWAEDNLKKSSAYLLRV